MIATKKTVVEHLEEMVVLSKAACVAMDDFVEEKIEWLNQVLKDCKEKGFNQLNLPKTPKATKKTKTLINLSPVLEEDIIVETSSQVSAPRTRHAAKMAKQKLTVQETSFKKTRKRKKRLQNNCTVRFSAECTETSTTADASISVKVEKEVIQENQRFIESQNPSTPRRNNGSSSTTADSGYDTNMPVDDELIPCFSSTIIDIPVENQCNINSDVLSLNNMVLYTTPSMKEIEVLQKHSIVNSVTPSKQAINMQLEKQSSLDAVTSQEIDHTKNASVSKQSPLEDDLITSGQKLNCTYYLEVKEQVVENKISQSEQISATNNITCDDKASRSAQFNATYNIICEDKTSPSRQCNTTYIVMCNDETSPSGQFDATYNITRDHTIPSTQCDTTYNITCDVKISPPEKCKATGNVIHDRTVNTRELCNTVNITCDKKTMSADKHHITCDDKTVDTKECNITDNVTCVDKIMKIGETNNNTCTDKPVTGQEILPQDLETLDVGLELPCKALSKIIQEGSTAQTTCTELSSNMIEAVESSLKTSSSVFLTDCHKGYNTRSASRADSLSKQPLSVNSSCAPEYLKKQIVADEKFQGEVAEVTVAVQSEKLVRQQQQSNKGIKILEAKKIPSNPGNAVVKVIDKNEPLGKENVLAESTLKGEIRVLQDPGLKTPKVLNDIHNLSSFSTKSNNVVSLKPAIINTTVSTFINKVPMTSSLEEIEEKKLEERKKREERELEARIKRDELLKQRKEDQKRKNEERMKKALLARQAQEKGKQGQRFVLEEKNLRSKLVIQGQEAKQKELVNKKKQYLQLKANEVEGRRHLEGAVRLAKLKEQEEERLRTQALHKKEQEEAEKLRQQHRAEEKEAAVLREKADQQAKAEAETKVQKLYAEKKEQVELKVKKVKNIPLPVKSADNYYNIADLESDMSSDDERSPKEVVPTWAQKTLLLLQFRSQRFVPWELFLDFMPIVENTHQLKTALPSLRNYKRTSSAVWSTPPPGYKDAGEM